MNMRRNHHSNTLARANSLYRRVVANTEAAQLIDPTSKLFAQSGFGQVSPPDVIWFAAAPDAELSRGVDPRSVASGAFSEPKSDPVAIGKALKNAGAKRLAPRRRYGGPGSSTRSPVRAGALSTKSVNPSSQSLSQTDWPNIPRPQSSLARDKTKPGSALAQGDYMNRATDALGRIWDVSKNRFTTAWNPEDPIGLDPTTRFEQRRHGGMFSGPVGFANEAILGPAIAAGDTVVRGANALLHAGAFGVNQLAGEVGLADGKNDKRLARDLLGMTQLISGSVGRAPALLGHMRQSAQAAGTVVRPATETIHKAVAPKNYYTGKVARQLRKADPQTTHFGKMKPELLNEINEIRGLAGEPAIGTADLRIYEAVLKKLREKRIGFDGATPEQLGRSLYRVFHGKKSIVEPGQFPTSQRLVAKGNRLIDVGYAGRGPKDGVSIKSIMRVDDQRLKKKREASGLRTSKK